MILRNGGEGQKRQIHLTLTNDKVIKQFSGERDYDEYINDVFSNFRFVNEFFPLLNICLLPTVAPKELFIYGWLLPADLCGILKKEEFGMYILAYYPSKYPKEDIEVEDICKKIDWNLIPKRHRHIRALRGRQILCTHHPAGEINDVPVNQRTVKILMSAWKLYYQYKKYIKTKVWDLDDLPHESDAALKILKEDKDNKLNEGI